MTVVFVEAQLWVSSGGAEVAGMILAIMIATAADAWLMPIPVPDKLIKRLLRLLCEVT